MHLVHDPHMPAAEGIGFDDVLAVDIRAGTVVEARPFPEARRPSVILVVDFGPGIGRRKSAAQIVENHPPETLPGLRVMAVVNLPPRQIGPIRSEVLVLGFADTDGRIRLAGVGEGVPDGARLA